jgi:hypothetical protein
VVGTLGLATGSKKSHVKAYRVNTGSSRLINMQSVQMWPILAHGQDCYLLLCLFLAHENLCIVEVATYLCLVLAHVLPITSLLTHSAKEKRWTDQMQSPR